MDVAAWLRGLGLGRYETAFRDNDVDAAVLPSLTAEDLKELGVSSIGHRRRLLDAVAALRGAGGGPPTAPPCAAAPGGADGAERRQVAVLFCDLAGSTALSARLDPEDLREVMAAYHRAATEAVRREGGHVARFLGDGVLAYFGWPEAHEDDAERAVRSGLAAAAAVAGLGTPAGPLAARVGIATGPVVVGQVVGEGEARERGAVGETPNLAARLQALAEPGAVVVDAATRGLTGALFAWADLGEAALKGVGRPVRAWRALSESGVESRFEALRAGHAAPLVGRSEELDMLLRRWRRARSGEGQVVMMRGEAGIGKSRLCAALRDALRGEEHEGLQFYCSPRRADSALHPVVARLERAAGLAPGDAPEERLAKLEALLAPLDPPREDVALVADLLSVPTLGRWPTLDLSPQRRRERLLQALVRRVRSLAAHRPVLAVVEDAHWADPSTRELLDLLVARAPETALLLVVTHRPEFGAGAWEGAPHVALRHLNRLAGAEHAALLRRVAGGKALPPAVEAEVLARTDGVPLFVEEVGRAVLESGLLREEGDRWVLDGPLPRLAVPATLQASLVARLDRSASVREVAQAGAVLGREFAHDLLAAVSGLPEPPLREALDRLAGAGIVQRRGTPPDAVYAFRHALIQDAAHGTLLRERRRDLHRRAAEAIGRLHPEAAERAPEVLAHHWAEAGVAEAAVEHYLRAGQRSATRSAVQEARAHLARGLALLPGVPQGKTARRLEAGLQFGLGHVAFLTEGPCSAEVARACGRTAELCRGLGEDALLARALTGLWSYRVHAGDLSGALLAAEEAVTTARGQDASDLRWVLPAALGMTQHLRGRSDLARPVLEAAAAGSGAHETGDMVISGGSIAQTFLARLLAKTGALDRSAAHAAEAIEQARRAGNLSSLLNALVLCCVQAWLVRDAALLRARVGAIAELAEVHGSFLYWTARARGYEGWVAAEEGRVQEGIGLLLGCLAALRTAGMVLTVPHVEAMLSDAYLLAGDAGAALAHAEEALRVSARTGEVWFDAELHRRVGGALLRLRPGEAARAEGEYRRALQVARSQSARLFELRAARELALLRRGQGRLAEARGLLAPVYAAFTEGFAFPDLVEARALLEDLGGPGARGEPVRSGAPETMEMRR